MKKTFVIFMLIMICVAKTSWSDYPDQALTEFLVVDGEEIPLVDGADFSGKDLQGAEIFLYGKKLKNVNFSKANLKGATFEDIVFLDCDFTEANLTDAYFSCRKGRKMTGCRFNNAIIFRAKLNGLNKNQLLSTFNYPAKDLAKCTFCNCDFSGVNFSGYNLRGAGFYQVNTNGCNFADAQIKGAKFSGNDSSENRTNICMLLDTKDFTEGLVVDFEFNRLHWPEHVVDLSRTAFINCFFDSSNQLAKVNLEDSIISGTNFRFFHGLTLENVKSTWNYKNDRMEGITLPEEIQKALEREKASQ